MVKFNYYWWYCILGYLSYMIGIFVNSLFMTFTDGQLQNLSFNSGALLNITQFIFAGLICLLIFRLLSKNNLTREAFGIHFQTFFKAIGIGSILGLLFFGSSLIAETYSEELRKGGEEVAKGLNLGQNFTNDVLLLLNIGLFAPVIEEIIFRGAIFNPIIQGLKRYRAIPHWVALLIGLIVSTFAFTSTHGGGGQDEQMFFLALLSILAALSFYYTKSLFAPIFVHAVNNNIVFILLIYKSYGFDSSQGILLLLLSIICLAASIPLTLLFGKLLKR